MSTEAIPELDAKGLRRFALTTGAIVAVLFGALLPWVFGFRYPVWPWVVLLVLGVWGIAAPATMRPVYIGWMRFGLVLNKITTPLIMGTFFYVVIFPVGLAMRTLGKDPMRRRFDSTAESYRIASAKSPKDNFERPF